MWRAWIIFGLALTACTEFPEVDAALAQAGPVAEYPALVPFEQLISAPDPRLTEGDDAALRARAAGLRNRANGLRGPVIDPQIRDRMNDGVAQP
ncbi:MAG: hypothetical protein ACSHXH_01565 [Marivita sp.]|uniref:hypothetical protein n=1 Tax=Marivita sp. TaxID=2003365 RepID=UPI003EF2590C